MSEEQANTTPHLFIASRIEKPSKGISPLYDLYPSHGLMLHPLGFRGPYISMIFELSNRLNSPA